MEDSSQIIRELTDGEAIEAVGYLAGWMEERLKNEKQFATKIQEEVMDEQKAIDILGCAYPELSEDMHRINYEEGQKGQAARNFLNFLYEQKDYTLKVKEALDRPTLKGEPITIALFAALFFFFSLEFDLEFEETNGIMRKKLRVSRKVMPLDIGELWKKIFGS